MNWSAGQPSRNMAGKPSRNMADEPARGRQALDLLAIALKTDSGKLRYESMNRLAHGDPFLLYGHSLQN